MTNPRQRLLSRVVAAQGGCWRWTGKVTKAGYGATGHAGKRHVLAHRAVYTELIGAIPAGLSLDHTCHNADAGCAGGPACPHRRCVNPAHLEPSTSVANSARAGMGRRTHCPKDHPYTPENTRTVGGSRFCRQCQRDSSRTAKQKRKAERELAR